MDDPNAEDPYNVPVPANEEMERETDIPQPPEKPYNVSVPLSRVKRVIKQDDDIVTVSASAVYAIASATELFVQYFSEQAYVNARADQRKRLTYNDFANAVNQQDRFEFLSTLVPKALPYKTVKKARAESSKAEALKNQTYFTTDANKNTTLIGPRATDMPLPTDQSVDAPSQTAVPSSSANTSFNTIAPPAPGPTISSSANPLSNILSSNDAPPEDTTMSEVQ